jgi:hypothetical protein
MTMKRRQAALSAQMRAQGKTWVEVAAAFRQRFNLNPRTAFRLARGWSQSRAANEWNARWPDETKTFKNFSYWEAWPEGGHAPAPENLARLANLYECSVSDLLADQADYRHLDEFQERGLTVQGGTPATCTGEIIVPRTAETLLLDLLDRDRTGDTPVSATSPTREASHRLIQWLEEIDFTELAQVIMKWMQYPQRTFDRRALLAKLSAALAVAAAAPTPGTPSEAAETNRSAVKPAPAYFDPVTLAHCAESVTNLRKQADVLGAQLTLPNTLAYRSIAEIQAKSAPATLRQHAISVYAELTQLVGWLCFNMGDYGGAQHHYDIARSAAHEAKNVELVTYILCTMSHLATWQGMPRVGIDHAAAAATWARQARSPHARAYAADVAVRAFIADNQPEQSRAALGDEHAALTEYRSDMPFQPYWYFFDESFYWRTEAEHALKFKRPNAAIEAADRSLALSDQGNLHNRAFRMLFRAEAFLQQSQIAEASEIIKDVVALTTVNTTSRIDQRVSALRSGLNPWHRSRCVRELDQAIQTYRGSPASGKGSTKRTYSL